MAALVSCIQQDRRKYYSPDKFENLFKEFDKNDDGFLDKSEMSILIKKTFSPSENEKIVLKELDVVKAERNKTLEAKDSQHQKERADHAKAMESMEAKLK